MKDAMAKMFKLLLPVVVFGLAVFSVMQYPKTVHAGSGDQPIKVTLCYYDHNGQEYASRHGTNGRCPIAPDFGFDPQGIYHRVIGGLVRAKYRDTVDCEIDVRVRVIYFDSN